MNQDFIRRVDHSLGIPVCFVLTRVRRLLDLFGGRRRALLRPKKIVFLKLIEQGASVLAHAAATKAAAMVGRENVYFCVFSQNRAILDILDVVPRENVIEIRDDGLITFALDCLKAMARCRRLGIDTTIDLEAMSRAPAILAFLLGARRRVGLHRFTAEAPYRGDLMTDRVQYNPHIHTAEQYVMLVDSLEAPPGQVPLLKVPASEIHAPPPRFTASQEERETVRQLIESEAGETPPGPLVLLNPNASDLLPLRRWQTDRFVELGQRLLAEDSSITLAITGAPSERSAAEQVARAIGGPPRVLCLAGKTTLRQLVVLYTLADVLVTNDSGPGHFASMTDIHNIVMFGPETSLLWGPRGGRPHVVSSELACSPCVNVFNHISSPCTDNVCMQQISVEQIFTLVNSCLAKPRTEGAESYA